VKVHGVEVNGVDVDLETRCAHYHAPNDIIAIKFACCGKWFPCHQRHAERADHTASLWSREHFDEGAVLCGACGHQLTIREYLDSGSVCPRCSRQFNPGCARHHHFYFAT
jgi:uncharacterized CHY-type Zn-finger protein